MPAPCSSASNNNHPVGTHLSKAESGNLVERAPRRAACSGTRHAQKKRCRAGRRQCRAQASLARAIAGRRVQEDSGSCKKDGIIRGSEAELALILGVSSRPSPAAAHIQLAANYSRTHSLPHKFLTRASSGDQTLRNLVAFHACKRESGGRGQLKTEAAARGTGRAKGKQKSSGKSGV